MHQLKQLIRNIERTHRGLGPMVATNIVCAKAKRAILNIAPQGCGKSTVTDTVAYLLGGKCTKYTSLTLAGLIRIAEEMIGYNGHIIIDDLGAEKSTWSRTSTISTLAHLVHTHYVDKISKDGRIKIGDFQGSAALNIQPVMMHSIISDDDWIAVIRDKVLRYYHMIRPLNPKRSIPSVVLNWGIPLESVHEPKMSGQLWYQLVTMALIQWSYGRVKEHIPMMLKAMAALDDRDRVQSEDYKLLIKILKPIQAERYLIESYGFEEGRAFMNNVYCILVELASHGEPTIETIAVDYKVNPSTVARLVATCPEWCFVKENSPTRISPTEQATKIFSLMGVNQKW